MPPRPLSASKSTKLLVFADSGWGKTRLAGTSPGKVGFIRPPVEFTDSILPADRDRCVEWVASDYSDLEDVHEEVRMAPPMTYDWIWFDSASGWQDIGLDDLWETIITENPKRARYGMDKGDYWINMQRIGRWVRDMVKLADKGYFNFGITAWPKELAPSPDDPERIEKLMPFIQGKNMASKFCGYMNVVAFGDFTDKGNRVLRFMENERYYAKTQFDQVGGPGTFQDKNYTLIHPTIPKLDEMIKRSRGSKAKPAKVTKATKATVKRPVRVKKGS